MNNAPDRAVLRPDLFENAGNFGTVSDVNGAIDYFAAGSGYLLQSSLQFTSGNNLLVTLFYLFGVKFPPGMFKNCPFYPRLFGKAGKPFRFGLSAQDFSPEAGRSDERRWSGQPQPRR